MMIYRNIVLYGLWLLACLKYGKGITIKAIAYSQNGAAGVYTVMANEFNKYSIKNNLNITMEVNYFSRLNSTGYVDDYETTLELLLKQRSKKYDLYFYDNVFSIKYGAYLENLRKWIPSEHFEIYESGIASQSCVYGKKWVGLPINVDISFLYYNHKYLNKYDKKIPTTWNELLETGKYIMNEEKKLNNTDIIIYNGLFSKAEIGTCSLYEFIYSYRNKIDSPFPELRSKESIKALEMIKTIKKELSNNELFQSNEIYSGSKFRSGEFLFQKFWYYPSITEYKFTLLPGRQEGISGSVIGGYNLGMNKYINEEHRNASIIAFKFLTSKEVQKKLVLKNNVISAIPSLYEDEEVCSFLDCNIFKNVQLINRPTNKMKDYVEYSKKFREYSYEYLYGNKTASAVLEEIDDITRIHYFSIYPEENIIGFVIFTLITILIAFMMLSLIFLNVNKFKPYFKFLPNELWVLVVTGSCIMLSALYTELGEIKVYKCYLKPLFLCVGFTVNIIPILYKLIINFPEKNKLSVWVFNHKYIFLSIFIILDIISSGLFMISPYNTKTRTIIEGKIYHVCKGENNFGMIVVGLMLSFRVIIFLCIMILIFIEWNIRETYYDIRFLLSAVFTDLLCYTIIFMLKYLNIKELNYVIYFIIYAIINIVFSVSNYIFLYAAKLYIIIFVTNKKDQMLLKRPSTYSFRSVTIKIKNENNLASVSLYQKIINFHYIKSTESLNSISSRDISKTNISNKGNINMNNISNSFIN